MQGPGGSGMPPVVVHSFEGGTNVAQEPVTPAENIRRGAAVITNGLTPWRRSA